MKYILSLSMLLVSLVACNQQNKKEETAKSATDNTQVEDPKIQKILTSYLSLKDALVNSDSTAAKTAGSDLSKELADVQGCQNTSKYADSVSMANDLESQRSAFTVVSSDIISLMKHADIKKGNIFIQHCPMANNGKGGYWMANEKEIKNPYYGDEMLECGSVEETLTKK